MYTKPELNTEWFNNQIENEIDNKIYQRERDELTDELNVWQACGDYIDDLINHLQRIKIKNSTYSLKLQSEVKLEFELIPAPYTKIYKQGNNENE